MRKRIFTPVLHETRHIEQDWLDIENLVEVEITSENTDYPIEGALLLDQTSGWRAGVSGEQTIRLIFESPQHIHRIWLNFIEPHTERTQEYDLRWSSDGGQSFQEIVRQQWNFNPHDATSQTEDYYVDLAAVTVLELNIIPDISGEEAFATLKQLRLT